MIPIASPTEAHAGDRIARPLSVWDAAVCRTVLATEHKIEVRVRSVGEVVHLYPHQPLTVPEEVTVLRQFFEFTDSPLACHAETDVLWTCINCGGPSHRFACNQPGDVIWA